MDRVKRVPSQTLSKIKRPHSCKNDGDCANDSKYTNSQENPSPNSEGLCMAFPPSNASSASSSVPLHQNVENTEYQMQKLDVAPLPITEKLGVLGRVVYDDRRAAIGSTFAHHNLHATK